MRALKNFFTLSLDYTPAYRRQGFQLEISGLF
jgi:hypothetical protein